ncbi:MAG: polyphosphate kinase 1 [Bacteroidia bacterium]|nr:polyphosphate kinase 1 [Bacteroidia bacterium]
MAKKILPYVNREISWLSFNERVLQEAADVTTPLLERLKFLGIFSNNRDEFFRIRVATVKRMLPLGRRAIALIGTDPNLLLFEIQQKVIEQQHRFEEVYQEILDELRDNNIFIINEKQLSAVQKDWVKNYFFDEVFSELFPIVTDETKKFPYLKDKSGYLFIRLISKNKNDIQRYGVIEVPVPPLKRFIVLPADGDTKFVMLLDDVIRFCMNDIFSVFGYKATEAYNIKLTRDAEIDIDNDFSENMVEKISKGIKKRQKGQPVRLVFDGKIPKDMLKFLMAKIKLTKKDNPIPGGRYHNFKDFIKFPKLGAKELVYNHPHPLNHPRLNSPNKSILKTILEGDILLNYPYQNFDHIISLLREASIDPRVQSIKITLYRLADSSKIANALINAVKNGKSVTVLMELRARFDEENNIYWSDRFQEEGVKVIFGVPGLKVHSKLFLITAREGGKEINYVHAGTGNFNENTARIYSDTALLTADPRITLEVKRLFEFFENNFRTSEYKHLVVAPFNMRKKFLALIQKEIYFAKKKQPARIILKLNNLVDREMINALYKASKAGVKIKLIVRGICSLGANMEGVSENIYGISIVDKYLEHSRIFIFNHGGEEKVFLSSADWMSRNLDNRIEVAIPVYDPKVKQEIKDLMLIQLSGNTKARLLDWKLQNKYRPQYKGEKKVRTQNETYEYFLKKGEGKTKFVTSILPTFEIVEKKDPDNHNDKPPKKKKGK